jgi:hypothetical protein
MLAPADDEPTRALAARYDALWDAAAPDVRRGRVTLDPWLARKDVDTRRGVTLLARPAPAVADGLVALCGELRALEPEQYYHPRPDLHLTVLSLLSATADYAPYLAHAESYRAAVEAALDGAPAFAVEARGVTLSHGAVLVQGFPAGDALARQRERLRTVLAERGLGASVDARYRLETAHTTLVRFVAPLRDPARFVDALAAARARRFGTTVVERLELTLSDWYQSAEHTRPLGAFALERSSARR